MHFNYYSLFLIAALTLGLGYFANNVHAEAQVIDRIYLIVNSQMLTRSEAQDVAAAIQAQKSSEEKTKKELNEQL
ncbi:MAG: peptidylprolyl isomerase, partial [SAR324 cluster bacterium]|nr:peptidylprolyl isomerase [SAR324 cluster bacterium]